MSHTCHVNECKVQIKPSLLMCPRHWKMVPDDLQKLVTMSFRVGQCNDKRPSMTWLKAARDALNYVARLEGNFIERP